MLPGSSLRSLPLLQSVPWTGPLYFLKTHLLLLICLCFQASVLFFQFLEDSMSYPAKETLHILFPGAGVYFTPFLLWIPRSKLLVTYKNAKASRFDNSLCLFVHFLSCFQCYCFVGIYLEYIMIVWIVGNWYVYMVFNFFLFHPFLPPPHTTPSLICIQEMNL